MNQISEVYLGDNHLTHHALRDAMDQAEIFKQMLEEVQQKWLFEPLYGFYDDKRV